VREDPDAALRRAHGESAPGEGGGDGRTDTAEEDRATADARRLLARDLPRTILGLGAASVRARADDA